MTNAQTARSTLQTASASRYLQQLCKHFEHKLPVAFDPNAGTIEFPFGLCALTADEATLTMVVTPSEPEMMDKLQDVVARHLVRFAFREELDVVWTA